MRQENKVILSAILILGVAMLSFNFLSLTGGVVNCVKSTATVSPSVIDGGEVIKVSVGGGKGFYDEARVFTREVDRLGKTRDSRIQVATTNACSNSRYKCSEAEFMIQTFSSDVSKIWKSNQDYVIRLKDICTGDFTIEAPFRIR